MPNFSAGSYCATTGIPTGGTMAQSVGTIITPYKTQEIAGILGNLTVRSIVPLIVPTFPPVVIVPLPAFRQLAQ